MSIYSVNLEESTFPSAAMALDKVIELLGPDQFMELVGHGILDYIKPGYQYIWQEAIKEIIAEQEAAEQDTITHGKRG